MIYTFKNKLSGEIFDINIKISEYDVYVSDHPELERYIDIPPAVSYEGKTFSASLSPSERVQGGFKEVLQKIAEKNPHTHLGDLHRKNKTVKEIKTREIVREYAKKKVKKIKEAVESRR